MTRPDPIPSTGKRHPIFARVFARVGPAMDAQGAWGVRTALLHLVGLRHGEAATPLASDRQGELVERGRHAPSHWLSTASS